MQFKIKRGNRNKNKNKNKNKNNQIQKREGGCCPSSSCPPYPYPSYLNTFSFLSIRLAGQFNYVKWKEQMLCLLDSQGMRGFIQKPHGSKRKLSDNKKQQWKRSDTLVKGWIFGSIFENMMETVIGLETAHDVWNKLETICTASIIEEETKTDNNEKCEEEYVPLCRAIGMGYWEKAQEFFNKDKVALTNKLDTFGRRTLHLAIGNPENIKFLENLLDLINPESLPTLVDDNRDTALHYAALLDNTKAAEKLVEKNPHLLFILNKEDWLPIETAIIHSHKATFLYLLQACKRYIGLSEKEGHHSPFKGRKGYGLFAETMWSGFFDVTYELLREYPELATTIIPGMKPSLWTIAIQRDAFRSAKSYNFYQRFLYSHVPTTGHSVTDTYKTPADIENQETNRATKCPKSYPVNSLVLAGPLLPASSPRLSITASVMKRIYVKFWEFTILHVPHIKHLHEDKVKHNNAVKILEFICEEVVKLKSNHYLHYSDAFIGAVLNNTLEVIEVLTDFFPRSVWTRDIHGYALSQLSIMNRCEHVYNFFVHKVTHEKYLHNSIIDVHENNLLHLAGLLTPAHKLNLVTGAALQMQRELQWFQNVTRLIRPKYLEAHNKKGETPIMIFRKEHEALRQKGEEWIKKTADSYTITAALIITVVFAAAITVPGGNNGDTGKAIYERKRSFLIFAISDAISFFTSTTSLLLFLSILTARYAEEDFLYKLPKRLILGLVMLFMSVTTMLIAFSATLYITFGQENSWILIPIASITCLPIASFMTLQLPLLVDLISSTYGPGNLLQG